jgi:hypothetical protein
LLAKLESQAAVSGQGTPNLADILGDFEKRINESDNVDLSTGQS